MYWPFPRAQRGLLSSLTHLPPTNIIINQKIGGWRSFSQKVRRIAAGARVARSALVSCRKVTVFVRLSREWTESPSVERSRSPVACLEARGQAQFFPHPPGGRG